MELFFSSKKFEKQLSSEKEMKKAFGHVMPNLQIRLSTLSVVKCLADVPHTKPEGRHELSQNRKGQFAVWLTKNYRLIFKPEHDPVPVREDGGFDLNAITAIRLIEVEDYHGN